MKQPFYILTRIRFQDPIGSHTRIRYRIRYLSREYNYSRATLRTRLFERVNWGWRSTRGQEEQRGSEAEMPIHRPAPQGSRVIAHVDMDCFYVQGPISFPRLFLLLFLLIFVWSFEGLEKIRKKTQCLNLWWITLFFFFSCFFV